ncbi:hypothetical protein LWI28_027900 [Acer negundo]|uniref:Endonuclease/exonuclease/phosphatase domain-containing protein n=1 Tax=Acer negundo TaxID=4023 RepID=A0AAD5IBY7_ACENE|nr:hypothetical protein LWI28_027900 [Acer negundo]
MEPKNGGSKNFREEEISKLIEFRVARRFEREARATGVAEVAPTVQKIGGDDQDRALSWNVKGLRKEVMRRKVRNVMQKLQPAVFFIQETKLGVYDSKILRELGGVVLAKGIGVEAEGSTGGLLTL